jgi:hypothetical protein
MVTVFVGIIYTDEHLKWDKPPFYLFIGLSLRDQWLRNSVAFEHYPHFVRITMFKGVNVQGCTPNNAYNTIVNFLKKLI